MSLFLADRPTRRFMAATAIYIAHTGVALCAGGLMAVTFSEYYVAMIVSFFSVYAAGVAALVLQFAFVGELERQEAAKPDTVIEKSDDVIEDADYEEIFRGYGA